PARGRGGSVRLPQDRRGRGGRRARRPHGRGRAGLRRAEGRAHRDGRGGHGVLRDAARPVQVPQAGALPGCPAEEPDRQGAAERTPTAGVREETMADDTLARMFWARVDRSASGPAQQWKRGGAWQTRSWRETGDAVREVALGLLALGRQAGEAVGIL